MYKQEWIANENEVDVGSDFTELHEIKDGQSDTVNMTRTDNMKSTGI